MYSCKAENDLAHQVFLDLRRSSRLNEYLYHVFLLHFFFFFSSRRRHTRCSRDWSSDVCSSDLVSVLPTQVLLGSASQVILTGSFTSSPPRSGSSIKARTRTWCRSAISASRSPTLT